ncbi:hypothetical protein [Pseudonocardia acaciae]|uniref:hypothetical protein n=1 Tax=Pseudonocardia acaciae TaxID=551276 RepID=UPI0012EDFAA0|nr:hypothetical protein [Pseudonocardia acaciae]
MAQAVREGAWLRQVTGPALKRRLSDALDAAAREQQRSPGYAAELQLWTRRYAGSQAGITPDSVATPPVGLVGASPPRPTSSPRRLGASSARCSCTCDGAPRRGDRMGPLDLGCGCRLP